MRKNQAGAERERDGPDASERDEGRQRAEPLARRVGRSGEERDGHEREPQANLQVCPEGASRQCCLETTYRHEGSRHGEDRDRELTGQTPPGDEVPVVGRHVHDAKECRCQHERHPWARNHEQKGTERPEPNREHDAPFSAFAVRRDLEGARGHPRVRALERRLRSTKSSVRPLKASTAARALRPKCVCPGTSQPQGDTSARATLVTKKSATPTMVLFAPEWKAPMRQHTLGIGPIASPPAASEQPWLRPRAHPGHRRSGPDQQGDAALPKGAKSC